MPESNQGQTEFVSPSAISGTNTYLPQFSNANYGKPTKLRCELCSHSVYSEFFRVNGQKICPTCADQIRSGISTPSHGSLLGALLLGIVGASAGCVLYSTLALDTSWTVGYP